ncbi:MAG: ScpA family protein [Nanoarchaeota archaeon]
MEDRIFQMVMHDDEITWQSVIYDLVRKEQMNPWDIDVSRLAKKYIEMIRQLQESNFRVSGKMVLAAAILLKLKSSRLIGQDLDELDRVLLANERTEEEFYDELAIAAAQDQAQHPDTFQLIPKTPQPRKRKVSMYDLLDALQKAIEVKRRRVIDTIAPAPEVTVPKKQVNISDMIQQVHSNIIRYFQEHQGSRLTFAQLLPSDSREDKVHTFIPLLHLSNQQKVDLSQEVHFGDIEIMLRQTVLPIQPPAA